MTQFVERVYVVDDGSDDETKSVLADLSSQVDGIKTITLPENSGKGKALTTGFAAAYADGYEYAVALDADGQHFAEDIPVLVSKVSEERPTLVCGVRNITTLPELFASGLFSAL